jgi:hypothetical protein
VCAFWSLAEAKSDEWSEARPLQGMFFAGVVSAVKVALHFE